MTLPMPGSSVATRSQYLIHDDSNLNPKVPAYWVVNMHTSHQITKNVQAFGLVQNLFNQRYYSSGTFFDTGAFNNSTLGGPNLLTFNDPRTFLPGMPFGLRWGQGDVLRSGSLTPL